MAQPGDEPALEDDRELLDGFRRGDKAALARVFRRYARDVARTVLGGVRVEVDGAPQRLGGALAPWDLENLVQETFVKAFHPKARLSYDGVRPFGAWLAVIARNVLVDRARKASRERARIVFVDDVAAVNAVSEEGDAQERASDKQLGAVVRSFLATLSADDRTLFERRYVEQRSLREAARDLALPLYELRRRDARLRLALLEALEGAGLLESGRVHVGTSVLERGIPRGKREKA